MTCEHSMIISHNSIKRASKSSSSSPQNSQSPKYSSSATKLLSSNNSLKLIADNRKTSMKQQPLFSKNNLTTDSAATIRSTYSCGSTVYSSFWFPAISVASVTTMAMVSVLLIGCGLSMGGIGGVEGRPFETEIYRTYDHRSAINNLKELDKFYTMHARPRYGKRFDSGSLHKSSSDQDQDLKALLGSTIQPESQQLAPTEIAAELLGNNRWICYNKPSMTKLTENYLKEILLEKNPNESGERAKN